MDVCTYNWNGISWDIIIWLPFLRAPSSPWLKGNIVLNLPSNTNIEKEKERRRNHGVGLPLMKRSFISFFLSSSSILLSSSPKLNYTEARSMDILIFSSLPFLSWMSGESNLAQKREENQRKSRVPTFLTLQWFSQDSLQSCMYVCTYVRINYQVAVGEVSTRLSSLPLIYVALSLILI
jgi:hypothetical protein